MQSSVNKMIQLPEVIPTTYWDIAEAEPEVIPPTYWDLAAAQHKVIAVEVEYMGRLIGIRRNPHSEEDAIKLKKAEDKMFLTLEEHLPLLSVLLDDIDELEAARIAAPVEAPVEDMNMTLIVAALVSIIATIVIFA